MLEPYEAVSVCAHPQLAVLCGVEAPRTDITGRSFKAVRDSAIQAYARNNPDATLRVFIGSRCSRSGNLVGLQPGERAAAAAHDAGFRAIPHCSSVVLGYVDDLIVMHAQAGRYARMFAYPLTVAFAQSSSAE